MIDYATYDDQALMRAIAQPEGDKAAFTAFYDRHADRLYQYMVIFLKDELEAEEVVQKLFVRIWQRREFLHEITDVQAYVNTMCRNMAYNRFREVKSSKTLREKILQAAVARPERPADADAQVIAKEQWALLQRALDTLPPQRRKVFELCKLHGYSYKQVCDELGIGLPTVAEHVLKAKRDLRVYLNSQGDAAVVLLILLGLVGEPK